MIIIRKASRKDIPDIVNFQISMAQETENLELDILTVTNGVTKIFDSPEIGEYIIAEKENKNIATLLKLFEWSDWRNGKVIWIHSVYVMKDYRKNGVFYKMYESIKNEVEKEEYLKGIRLFVDKTNINAQKVYESIGMTAEHYKLYEWLK